MAFIDTYGTSIIKPSIGSFGSGIIVVQREQEGFAVKTHEHVHQMNGEEFGQLISMLAAQKGFIIQKFVRTATRNGLPYHIRLHLVRNGSGEWSFISAFPFLSIPSEYKVVNDAGSLRAFTTWDCLSRHEFPNKEEVMLMRLERMATMTTDRIAGHVKERICELAIDVGIDSLGEIWIFEVNMNKIDSTHREFEVAQHMIRLLFLCVSSTFTTWTYVLGCVVQNHQNPTQQKTVSLSNGKFELPLVRRRFLLFI